MTTPPESIRDWAQRLVAASSQGSSGVPGGDLLQICETLRMALTQFVGMDGFVALLRRALTLARRDVPALEAVGVTSKGSLEGLEKFALLPPKDVEAAEAITTHLLHLLVTFIGESLTLRLIQNAWPDTSDRTKESEDLK